MAFRGVLAAMRFSSAVMRGEKLGSRMGGRVEEEDEGEDCCSAAMRDSAAARSAGVGSGSTSG